jgi:hypothetical protein
LRVQLAERVTSLINESGQPVLTQMYALPGIGANATLPMLPQASGGFAQPGAQGKATGGPVPLPPVSAQSNSTGGASGAPQIATASPAATPVQ